MVLESTPEPPPINPALNHPIPDKRAGFWPVSGHFLDRAGGGGELCSPPARPRLETVRLILRQQQAGPPPVCPPVAGVRPELVRIAVTTPTLSAYDALVEGSC